MERYYLIRFNRKSGKIDKTVEGLRGILQLWAIKNTTKTKDTVIFDKNTGDIVMYVTGTEGFPDVDRECGLNIEDLCPGMLLAMAEKDGD